MYEEHGRRMKPCIGGPVHGASHCVPCSRSPLEAETALLLLPFPASPVRLLGSLRGQLQTPRHGAAAGIHMLHSKGWQLSADLPPIVTEGRQLTECRPPSHRAAAGHSDAAFGGQLSADLLPIVRDGGR